MAGAPFVSAITRFLDRHRESARDGLAVRARLGNGPERHRTPPLRSPFRFAKIDVPLTRKQIARQADRRVKANEFEFQGIMAEGMGPGSKVLHL